MRDKIWFVTGSLKSSDHWVFDRTVDGKSNILEFFVVPDFEEEFLHTMGYFLKKGIVTDLKELPNRFTSAS